MSPTPLPLHLPNVASPLEVLVPVVQDAMLGVDFATMLWYMLEVDPDVRVDMAWVQSHAALQAVDLQGIRCGTAPNPLLSLP